MSRTLYARCESHDPPIRAEVGGESGQHMYDLRNAIVVLAGGSPRAVVSPKGQGWRMTARFAENTAAFRDAHPRCTVVIVDEYDEIQWRPERGHVCVEGCRPNAHIAFEGRNAADAHEHDASCAFGNPQCPVFGETPLVKKKKGWWRQWF